ncbi:MAG: hypothetical protein ABI239_06570 [Aquihabitans sp.]
MTTTFDYSAQQPSKGPKVLLTLGGIALGLGVVMVVIGVVLLGTGMFDTFKDLANARDNLEAEVAVPGTVEVYLQADTYDVVAIGDGLIRDLPDDNDGASSTTRTNFREPTVTVTTSEGMPLTLREPRFNAMLSVNSYDMVSISSFKVITPGTYVIAVTGEPGPVTAVGVGEAGTIADATVGKLIGGGVLFGLGFLLIIPGIGLLIGGGIWRSSDRKNRQPPVPGPPSSFGPPGGFPPGGPGGIPPFNVPGPPGSAPGQPPMPPPVPPWEPPQSPIS